MLIQEVVLGAADLAAQQRFYGETLGLPVEATAQALRVQVGESTLVFAEATPPAPPVHVAFNVPRDQFAAAREWLADRTPLLRDAQGQDAFFFEHWNAHACYALDAAGNIVELIARHTVDTSDTSAAGPFGTNSLLRVSEVGLPTDDVATTVAQLQGSLGLQRYGTGSAEFVALGDEQGLFIVVASGRPWFPATGVPALPTTLAVTLATDAGQMQLSGPPWHIAPSAGMLSI